MQGLAKEAIEHGAGGAVLVGDPDLAEDLALAGHERVEAGRHPEQVQGGSVVTEPVELGSGRQRVGGESFSRVRRHHGRNCDPIGSAASSSVI